MRSLRCSCFRTKRIRRHSAPSLPGTSLLHSCNNGILRVGLVILFGGLTGLHVWGRPITQEFLVYVESVVIEPEDPHLPVVGSPSRFLPGEQVVGSVFFDDSNLPRIGTYRIGNLLWGTPFIPPWAPLPDELQHWALSWPGLTSLAGFMIGPEYAAWLEFSNGRLSGIYCGYHPDIMGGPRDERFAGSTVRSHGSWGYNSLGVWTYSRYLITGQISLPSNVSEEVPSLLLLGMGLLFGRLISVYTARSERQRHPR